MRLAPAWRWIKHEELVIHLFVNLHYASFVAAAIAVIRCRENRHNGFLVIPIEPIHHKLVSSGNQFQVVSMVEVLRYVLAESEAGSSRRYTPAVSVVRVRPEQVAHGSFVRHLDLPVDGAYLIERVQIRREPAMQAENLVFDDCSEWQQIK